MNFFFYWHVQWSTVPQTWICLVVLFRRQWYMSKTSWCGRQIWKISLFNPRTYTQTIPPPWYKEGGGADGTPPQSFWYVAVFWNDFTLSWKPLIFLTRWGIFYGRWRCWRPVTSPTMVTILVLPRIINQVTAARNGNFLCSTWKITHK